MKSYKKEGLSFGEKNYFIRISVTIIFVLTVLLVNQQAFAVPAISFDLSPFPDYTLNDFAIVTVDDSGNPVYTDLGSGVQTISVTIASSLESKTIPLTETSETSGIFQNVALIFTEGGDDFSIKKLVRITQEETVGLTSGIDTITVDITATDPITGTVRSSITSFALTETGSTSGIFGGTLRLSFFSSSNGLTVAKGDRVSINYLGENAYGIVEPNPNDGVRTINVANCVPPSALCDTVTASFGGVSEILNIIQGGGGGGGGGGLLRPGLVLDFLGGGSSSDHAPPTFSVARDLLLGMNLPQSILDIISEANPFESLMPVDDKSLEMPLRVGDNGYPLYGFSQTIQTVLTETGTPLPIELLLHDDTGVQHVALYTNLIEQGGDIEKSDTYIIYEEGKPLQVTDPHEFFSNVEFSEYEEGTKYRVVFTLTFAKPMDTSDIIFRIWDEKRNSGDTKIFDAIKVVDKPYTVVTLNNLLDTESIAIVLQQCNDNQLGSSSIPNTGDGCSTDLQKSDVTTEEKVSYAYPEEVGKITRIDKQFKQNMQNEAVKAKAIAEKLVGTPFKDVEEKVKHKAFSYPSKIGLLDRKNTELLNEIMNTENQKAVNYYELHYSTNHEQD